MWLSRYFVYFIIFSCMGWIYESIYCTIRAKKWENRGFLYGPLCPIYGAGGVAITAIADFISAHTDATFTWWQIFLVAFLGSIVLEYGTSWALEKLFHAYWWDYSSMPLNINGRVCFPYSSGEIYPSCEATFFPNLQALCQIVSSSSSGSGGSHSVAFSRNF